MKNQVASLRLTEVASLGILLLVVTLAVISLVPPASGTGQDPEDFSAARVLKHIERIAQEPRPLGSPQNERARAGLIAELRLLGIETELQTIEARDYFGATGRALHAVNVLARIPGTAPTKAVLLAGHYDTVPGTPGANDDASAVGIMLEAARAILYGAPLRNDVILLFTDGEEPAPRYGSSGFVASHPWAADVGFLINLEAVGSGGPSILTAVSGSRGWIVDEVGAAVPYPALFSVFTATAELIGGSKSDFDSFSASGTAGIEFAYLHGSPIYHTANDSPENVSLRSLQHQGANTLALVRRLGDLDLDEVHEDSETVFFTIARLFVVRYPVAWALPIALVTAAALGIAGWRQRDWPGALRSGAATLAGTLTAAVVAVGLWMIAAGWRSAMGIGESYVYLGGLGVLCIGVVTATARLARRRIATGADALGVVLVWWVLGLLLAVVVPGMSYLFTWPALAGALMLLWHPSPAPNPWRNLVRWTLVAGTSIVLLVPAIDIFYQLAQPRPGNPDSQALPFIAVPVLLLALLVELLRAFRVKGLGPAASQD